MKRAFEDAEQAYELATESATHSTMTCPAGIPNFLISAFAGLNHPDVTIDYSGDFTIASNCWLPILKERVKVHLSRLHSEALEEFTDLNSEKKQKKF